MSDAGYESAKRAAELQGKGEVRPAILRPAHIGLIAFVDFAAVLGLRPYWQPIFEQLALEHPILVYGVVLPLPLPMAVCALLVQRYIDR